jgi:hypothetical protein
MQGKEMKQVERYRIFKRNVADIEVEISGY